MCLTTNDPTIKIADKDMYVYKELNFKKVGFFQRWFRPSVGSAVMYYHEYKQSEVQQKVSLLPYKMFGNKEEWVVDEGYHSHAGRYAGMDINALFKIPKGTGYIEGYNNNNESIRNYVSETIVFVRRLI